MAGIGTESGAHARQSRVQLPSFKDQQELSGHHAVAPMGKYLTYLSTHRTDHRCRLGLDQTIQRRWPCGMRREVEQSQGATPEQSSGQRRLVSENQGFFPTEMLGALLCWPPMVTTAGSDRQAQILRHANVGLPQRHEAGSHTDKINARRLAADAD